MGLVLGLDGGGTKTSLALADRAGEIVTLARGGGVDPLDDPDWARTLRMLFATLDHDAAEIEAGVFGLPCHGEIAAVTTAQDTLASRLLGARGLAANDVGVAFDGALGGDGGVLVLSGTGSMAWASAGGQEAPPVRVGGWGALFGDEGSAFWIGREALGLASRAFDGRSGATGFARSLIERIGVARDGLLAWAQEQPNRRARVAGLASLVSALAQDGDADARRLLIAAADHLADHALAAWSRVGADRPLTWTYAGGVLSSRPVRERITERLSCEPLPPRLPPVGGALLGAARRAGWDAGPDWIDRLGRSLALRQSMQPQEDWP